MLKLERASDLWKVRFYTVSGDHYYTIRANTKEGAYDKACEFAAGNDYISVACAVHDVFPAEVVQ